MKCTIEAILKNPQLSGIKLLAGSNYTSTIVSWLNILELLGDLSRLREDELVLTTGFDLHNHSANYAGLIRRLQSLQIAGLMVKLGTYIDTVPLTLIEQANVLAFPLLEVPPQISLSKASRSIIAQIKENENTAPPTFCFKPVPTEPSNTLASLDSHFTSQSSLVSRSGSQLSIPASSLPETYRIILAQLDDTPELRTLADKGTQEFSTQTQTVFSFINQSMQSYFPEISAASHSLSLMLALRDDATLYLEDLRSILLEIIDQSKVKFGLTTSFGVSNLCSLPDSMPLGIKEAQEALNVGKHILNQGYIALYENIELYRLFLQVPERKALIEFSKKTLEKVVAYDQIHGTELVRTLETYIQNDHSIKRTAELLYIHRHTVKNRLAKIEEISRISFRSEERFQLEFALTLKHLYRIKF